MVTVNEQGPPVSPKQTTFVFPIGKTESEGGLQTIVPQPVPDPAGVPKLTTFPHSPVSFVSVMFDGQLTSHVAGEIVTVAVKVLSVSNSSLVSLVTVAVLETDVPGWASESTRKTNVNWAVVLAGSVAMVQVELPVVPTSGLVHSKVAPVTWVSDWNVELVPTVTVNCTFSASFGPLFVTKTVKGALEPGDTWKGADIGHQRSTFALAGS